MQSEIPVASAAVPGSSPIGRNPHLSLWISLVLFLLTLGIFSPVLRHDFINYDDADYIVHNTQVQQGLTWPNVVYAFTTGQGGYWQPLTWLSYELDCQLFGLKAGGHHLTSALLHAANTVLLFLALRAMTGANWRSGLVAALFGLHPLHVESVAWIAERRDVLSTIFFILTIWTYVRYAQSRSEALKSEERSKVQSPKSKAFWYSSCLLLFALGLMSKPILVTTPFVLVLMDYWPLNRISVTGKKLPFAGGLKLLREKIPFFLFAFVSSIITMAVAHKMGGVTTAESLPFTERLENAIASYIKYLGKTFWPANLCIFYPHPGHHYPEPNQWPIGMIIAAAAGLLLLTMVLVILHRKHPYLITGWLWFLGILVPMIGIIQVGTQALADRYTYLPLIGIFFAVVWLGYDLLRNRFGRTALTIAGITVVAACTAMTCRQLATWRNSFTVFEHALRVTEGYNPVAHYGLGLAYGERGEHEKALEHFRAAAEEDPSHANAQYSLGVALTMLGKPGEALPHYEAALKIMPNHVLAHYSLAGALWLLGKHPEAIEAYEETLRLDPDFAEAHQGLGVALLEAGKAPQAEDHLTKALAKKPNEVATQLALGQALAAQGKLEAAEEQIATAMHASPNAQGFYTLGLIRNLRGDLKGAIAAFQETLKINPLHANALNDLAWILATQQDANLRNGSEAVRLAEQACQLGGEKEPRYWGTLDAAYAEAGRFPEAIATAEKTHRLANAAGQKEIADAADRRLARYRKQQPYRE